jgi:PAS domain S-box-containing protein
MPSSPTPLLLDPNGLVVEAGPAAASFFGRDLSELLNSPFVSLFEFEVVSRDPEILSAQWEVLCASACEQPVTLLSQRPDTGEQLTVSVALCATSASPTRWFATVSEINPEATTPVQNHSNAQDSDSLRLLGLHSQAGFFDLHFKESRFTYSPSWKKLLGYTVTELPDTYDTWISLLHPEDSGAAPDKFSRKAAQPGPRPFSAEFRMQHRRGNWIWIQCLGVLTLGEAGAVLACTGLFLDITERKLLEESSLSNDERLQRLTDSGPLAAFEFDFAPTPAAWLSPALKALLGYEPDELSDSADSFLHSLPDDAGQSGLPAWFASLGSTGAQRTSGTALLRTKDGDWLPLSLYCQRRYSKRQELLSVMGSVFPTPSPPPATATSESGDALLRTSLLSECLDALGEAVLLTDAKGLISFANSAALRLLDSAKDQVLGKPAHEIFRLFHVATAKTITDDVCELAIGSDGPLPLSNQHALLPLAEGREPTPIVWTARAAYSTSARFEGAAIVFRDPNEMSLSPEELVKANRFESLAMLAGGIAHDFNNLLTTILGGISLARDARNPSGLDDSEKASITAKGLTKQLLSFAKGGSGARTVIPSAELLHDSVKIAAAGSTVQVVVDANKDLPNIQVERSQMLQVFQNLIVNAIQAMPPSPHKGRVDLSLSSVSLSENDFPPLPAGDYLRFDVRDNASGIKPEHLERIWDPFFTTKKHGTGLGLATVLSIVRKHGGQIGVVSELGVGSVFTVLLPVARDPIESQVRRAPTLRHGTGRILFMDDDPKICSITAGMLDSLEYKSDIARNGEEAVKLYRSYFNINRPYDVVIMDLTVIGGMGGEEAFFRMKEMDTDVRAIAASGYDNEDMARRFLDLGFCGYLTKPYRVGDLAKVIKAVIG